MLLPGRHDINWLVNMYFLSNFCLNSMECYHNLVLSLVFPFSFFFYYFGTNDAVMTEQRMELWSDNILSEFAIKFNSTVVVKTSNNPDVLTKMIDICPYKIGYEIDWHYTLSQWVIYYLANKYVILLDLEVSKEKEFKILDNGRRSG